MANLSFTGVVEDVNICIMPDSRTAPKEFLSEFIDLYRENQCLWKIKSKDYSDRNEKKLGLLGAG
jgi:hypothetical protein